MMTTDQADRNQSRNFALEQVYWSKPAKLILPYDHFGLYRFVSEHIGRDQEIDYFEFGVARGKSITQISSLFKNDASRFFGFDSFVGLPEKWLMHDVGAFSTGGFCPQTSDKRLNFVEGWFQNSVPSFLANFDKDRSRPTLIHFDADLYSSTLFLLATLWPKFDEYYFIMDDFVHDEVIALRDFSSAFPIELQFFAQTKGGGERAAPDQVFGLMKRIRFELPAGQ